MLSPRVGAWAAGGMVMPHGRGTGLGQKQEFHSGVQSWCSLSTLLHCLPKVNEIRTLHVELRPWASLSGE